MPKFDVYEVPKDYKGAPRDTQFVRGFSAKSKVSLKKRLADEGYPGKNSRLIIKTSGAPRTNPSAKIGLQAQDTNLLIRNRKSAELISSLEKSGFVRGCKIRNKHDGTTTELKRMYVDPVGRPIVSISDGRQLTLASTSSVDVFWELVPE